MSPRIDRLWYTIEAETKGFEENILGAGDKLRSFTEYAAGQPLAVIGALGTAAVVAAAKATQMAATFEVEMKKVQTVAGNSAKMMRELSDGVLALFERLPVQSTQELSQGLYDIISSGIPAGEALQFLETAAKAAAGGFTSVDIVVDGLTTTFNAFKSQGKSVAEIADLMAKTVDVGKIEFSELAASMGNVAGTAATLGIPLEDILGLTAQLTLNGVKGAEAMTGIRSALANIIKPNEQLRKDFPDLAAKFDLAHLKAVGLTKFLIELNEATKGNERAMAAVLPDIQGFSAALTLLKDDGRGAAEMQRELAESAGAVDEKLKTVTETAVAQSQILRNQFKSAMIELGNEILPTVNAELRGMLGLLQLINGTADKIQQSSAETTLRNLSQVIDKLSEPRKREELVRIREALSQLVRGAGVGNALGADFLKGLSDERLAAMRAGLTAIAENAEQAQLRSGQLAQVMANIQAIDLEMARRPGRTGAEGGATTPAGAPPPPPPPRADPEKERERQRRLKEAEQDARALVKEIEDETAKLTESLVDDMLLQLERFKARAAPLVAQGLVPKEAVAEFTRLQEALIATQRQSEDLDAVLAEIRTREGEARDSDLVRLSRLQDALQAQRDGTEDAIVRKRLEAEIAKIEELRARLVERRTGANKTDTDEAKRQREEQSRKVREQAQTIKDAASGALELARAFGVVGDETERALRNIIDISAGIGPLVDALQKGGAGGIIGAALPVIGGLAGLISSAFGESPEEKARREVQRQNTEAIKLLTQRIGDLATATTPGQSLDAAQRVFGAASVQEALSANDFTWNTSTKMRNRFNADIYAEFARLGMTMTDVQELAKSLGITLDGSKGSWLALRDAITQADLAAFTDTFGGALERLHDSFEIYDITDPVERLRRTLAALANANTGIPAISRAFQGLDVGNAEDRTRAIARLQQLFEDLAAGRVSAADLGGASLTETRAQLLELLRMLREEGAAGPSGTGGFHVDRSITEVTGSYLRGLLTTANVWAQQTAENTAIIARALAGTSAAIPSVSPPALPPTATDVGGAGGIVINLTVPITLATGMTPADGEAIGRAAGQAAGDELDRILGERQRGRARAEGMVLLS